MLFQICKTVLNFSEELELIIVLLNCIVTFVYLVELCTNPKIERKLLKNAYHFTVYENRVKGAGSSL